MPELPEMQALAERLDARFAGAPLVRATPIQFSALKTFEPAPQSFVGRALERVGRRGKYLVFEFDGPRILVHLSQGGRADLEDAPKATRPKGAVVRFVFEGRGGLLVKEYGTQRKAGWWTLPEGDEGPLEALGPEPDTTEFEQLLLTTHDGRRLHTFLRHQGTVAGIGRGYADEIMHRARLSPYATVAKLTEDERAGLLEATRSALAEGLAEERKRTGGLPAKLAGRWRIHGQHGRPCPRCGETLQRVSFESHEIVYCPRCQTGGKILADRRLSRLVK